MKRDAPLAAILGHLRGTAIASLPSVHLYHGLVPDAPVGQTFGHQFAGGVDTT